MTVVWAPLVLAMRIPPSRRTTACPVSSSPVRPAIACQRRTTASVQPGLPTSSPPMCSIESHPTITASGYSPTTLIATASAFAEASAVTNCVGVAPASVAANASSSTPDTCTTGSIPAARSTPSRPADADARMRRTGSGASGEHGGERHPQHPILAAVGGADHLQQPETGTAAGQPRADHFQPHTQYVTGKHRRRPRHVPATRRALRGGLGQHTIHIRPHPQAHGEPTRCAQAAQYRPFRRLLVQMERLRIESLIEGEHLLPIDLGLTKVDHSARGQILE